MIFVGLAIAIICAVIAGSEAAKKGRSSGWGCLTLLFPPFLLVVLLLSPLQRRPKMESFKLYNGKTEEIIQDDEKVCPFCAEKIKKAAVVCKHCKKEITTG